MKIPLKLDMTIRLDRDAPPATRADFKRIKKAIKGMNRGKLVELLLGAVERELNRPAIGFQRT